MKLKYILSSCLIIIFSWQSFSAGGDVINSAVTVRSPANSDLAHISAPLFFDSEEENVLKVRQSFPQYTIDFDEQKVQEEVSQEALKEQKVQEEVSQEALKEQKVQEEVSQEALKEQKEQGDEQ